MWAAVRLVGVAFLGRPRSPRAAVAEEAPPPVRAALIGLMAAAGLVGLFPGAVLTLAGPALHRLVAAGMDDRAGLLTVAPQSDMPGYSAAGIALVMALAAGLAVWLGRQQAVPGHRVGPAWDGGFGPPPAWLPFGDPLTQYGGASFAQPLRRALGPALLRARETVDMPAPGDTRPAHVSVTIDDPMEYGLFHPVAALRARLSAFADRLQFLTIRRTLSLMFATLVFFLVVVALTEQ